jgi:DNA-binding GntR family transcriptional regulator
MAAGKRDPAWQADLRRDFDAFVAAAESGDEDAFWSADLAFHRTIVIAGGNQRLGEYIEGLRETVRVRGGVYARFDEPLTAIALNHLPLLEKIEAHNEQAAAEEMRKLLRLRLSILLRRLRLSDDASTLAANDR